MQPKRLDVKSFASVGLRAWATRAEPHGRDHDCLICADTRRYLDEKPLDRTPRAARRPWLTLMVG